MNEIITFTITIAGNGNPMTVTDPLPLPLVYLTSTLTCPGMVTYDATTQQVKYSGTPPAGRACAIQIPVRVNTDQRMAITNSATIDSGQPPLKSVSAIVILNELALYLPITSSSNESGSGTWPRVCAAHLNHRTIRWSGRTPQNESGQRNAAGCAAAHINRWTDEFGFHVGSTSRSRDCLRDLVRVLLQCQHRELAR